VCGLAALTVARPLANETGDWPAYAASNASTRYPPLDQINRENVKNLRMRSELIAPALP
jgi:glucose dehydrogenase